MSLPLKDRFKALARICRIVFDPNVDYINMMWQTKSADRPNDTPVYDVDEKRAIFTHTFFVDGDKPVNTMMTYMAHVAAKSDNLDDLNVRCEFYLNKVAVAHMLFNPDSDNELQYISEPIRSIPRKRDEVN